MGAHTQQGQWKLRYSTITGHVRQIGTVRQLNYPLLVKFISKLKSCHSWYQDQVLKNSDSTHIWYFTPYFCRVFKVQKLILYNTKKPANNGLERRHWNRFNHCSHNYVWSTISIKSAVFKWRKHILYTGAFINLFRNLIYNKPFDLKGIWPKSNLI